MTLDWESDDLKKHIERWKLTELESVINSFEDDFSQKVYRKLVISNDYKNILLHITGKSIVTAHEIICLVIYGYPDGALSLARNLYEQFVTVSFLERHRDDSDFDSYIADFYDDYDIQRYKAFKFDAEYYSRNSGGLQKANEELANIRKKSHHKGNGGFWWTGLNDLTNVAIDNIRKEENETLRTFLAELHLIYKRASMSLHSGCFGNSNRLGVSRDFTGVDTSPQQSGHEMSLYLSTCSLIMILGSVCREFGIDYSAYKEILNGLMLFYGETMRKEYAHT